LRPTASAGGAADPFPDSTGMEFILDAQVSFLLHLKIKEKDLLPTLFKKDVLQNFTACVFLLSLFLLLFGLVSAGFAARPEIRKSKISVKQQSFLETLQHDTFNFFWEATNAENGLTPDRFPDTEISSVAGVGFALTAYLVGVERGYITRSQAADRTLTTLNFLWRAPQGPERKKVAGYKGFFYHFLGTAGGGRWANAELSTIDTALLMAGILSSETKTRRQSAKFEITQRPSIAESIGAGPIPGYVNHCLAWAGFRKADLSLIPGADTTRP
jgi:hypothetical protein